MSPATAMVRSVSRRTMKRMEAIATRSARPPTWAINW